MANLKFIRKNRIHKELKEERWWKQKIILRVGIPLTAACFFIKPALGIIVGTVTALMIALCSTDLAKKAGADGEEVTLSYLATLPSEYIIFRQIEIPVNGNGRVSFIELDFIVCGPNGIFVIESKGLNGTISGTEEDLKWVLSKIGRGGRVYAENRRNPVRQVKAQIYHLKEYLRSKRIDEWISGFVALSNENSTDGIRVTSLPVVASAELPKILLKHENRFPVRDLVAVQQAIAELVPSE